MEGKVTELRTYINFFEIRFFKNIFHLKLLFIDIFYTFVNIIQNDNFMKRIYWLQNFLNITIWGSTLIFVLLIVVFFVELVTNDFSLIKIDGLDGNLNNLTVLGKVILGLICIGYVFFFWGLFKMKALVSRFAKRDFFSLKTAQLSKQIGYLFILSAIITCIPVYFYQLFLNDTFRIHSVEPGSFFFLVIIGIFFRTIGFLFEDAKNFKEDSELTV